MTDFAPDAGTERDKRSGVILRAAIEVDGVTVERRVRNLSVRGACVDNDGDLIVGTTVRVTMGVLEQMVAEVMWAKSSLAGLRFRRTIDLEAARKPRGLGTGTSAGWMTEVNHAYRKRA